MSMLQDDSKKYPNEGLEALAKEAPEVVKRMGYRDGESVVESLNSNPRVVLNGLEAAIQSKMLDLQDAQKNKDVEQVESISQEINDLDRQRILIKNELAEERPGMYGGGLLDDDRMKYNPGGKVLLEIAERLSKISAKRSKLEKELNTEDMSKASQQKNKEEIKKLDKEAQELTTEKFVAENKNKPLSEDYEYFTGMKNSDKLSHTDTERFLKEHGFKEGNVDDLTRDGMQNYEIKYDKMGEVESIVAREKVGDTIDEKIFKNPRLDDIAPWMGYAEGGEVEEAEYKKMSIDDQMKAALNMLPDDEMEDNYLDFIIDEALSEEEEDMLMSKLEQDEELSMLFDKVIEVASEFAGSGPVEGPGTGVSDSIPARLSDGEFVFTAKAVEEIGADNLMAMMKEAEMKADERQEMAIGGRILYGNEMDENRNIQSGVMPEKQLETAAKVQEEMLRRSYNI
jgi:hypothetical protein